MKFMSALIQLVCEVKSSSEKLLIMSKAVVGPDHWTDLRDTRSRDLFHVS